MQTRLTPPPNKGQNSVARVEDDWYIVCQSHELTDKPLAVTLMGTPLVVFRGADGVAGTLLDRCPHRNVPLSAGTSRNNNLECVYHGWQFDRSGTCRVVPGLCRDHEAKGRRVAACATAEQQGFVWVYAKLDAEPERAPFEFPFVDDDRYTTVRYEVAANNSIHAVAENALDVPHTAFLHKGLFRFGTPSKEIEVVVKRWHDRVEAEYVGEERPPGIAAKILAPGGSGTVTHFDRFILPSVAQVDYSLGDATHFIVSAALTPVSDFVTRLFAVISFRLPLPGKLVAPVLKPVALRIFKQDAGILAQQADAVKRFGGEQYMSTEIDVLGPQILRLMRQAERGERSPGSIPEEPVVKTFQMQV